MSDELKLYSPKDLAKVSPFSEKFIQRNAADFGFVKRGRKYVASEEMIKRALEDSSASRGARRIGAFSPSIVDGSLESPLKQLIRKTRQELRAKRREARKSWHGLKVGQRNIGE